jgi:hypothetical protein
MMLCYHKKTCQINFEKGNGLVLPGIGSTCFLYSATASVRHPR